MGAGSSWILASNQSGSGYRPRIDSKKIKDTAAAKLNDVDLGKAAGDAVVGAAGLLDGAEAAAD